MKRVPLRHWPFNCLTKARELVMYVVVEFLAAHYGYVYVFWICHVVLAGRCLRAEPAGLVGDDLRGG